MDLPGWVQAVLAGLNLTPSDLAGSTYPTQPVDFWAAWDHPAPDVTWKDQNGVVTTSPPAGAANQAAVGKWELQPIEECMYKTSYVRFDHYVGPDDSSGYVGFAGQSDETAVAPDGMPYGSGQFVYVGNVQQ
jgi:hypothetical protein